MLRIQPVLFAKLAAGFVLASIVGTLSHEAAHWLVAQSLGYDADFHYASVSYSPHHQVQPSALHSFYIGATGPAQTMLTGTIALMFLFWYRKKYNAADSLGIKGWTLIYITLFWLRQPAFFCMWLVYGLSTGNYPARGDEVKLARYLQMPDWSIQAATALAGLTVLLIVVFRFIPRHHRLTFLAAGAVGGVAGYLLWIEWLGRYIIP